MDCLLAMIAIVSFSLFVQRRWQVNAAIAPFFCVVSITLFLCLISITGLLYAGFWLVYLGALLSLIWLFVIKKEKPSILLELLHPGMVFFLLSSLAFYVILKVWNPYFLIWDEFSFWGSATKAVFLNRQIYTLERGSLMNYSYPPALPLFSVFVQFFGSGFSECKVYLAYDIMIMSVMSTGFTRLKWKNIAGIVIMTAFGLLSLYQFWWSFEGKYLYLTSYGDLQIAVVFGGVLMAWFLSEQGAKYRWAVAFAGVMLLPMIKDIGFALGLAAAGIISVDHLLAGLKEKQPKGKEPVDAQQQQKPVRSVGRKKLLLQIMLSLALMLSVLISYQIWNLHFRSATELSRIPNPYEYSAVDMLMGRDEDFIRFTELMGQALLTERVVMFGSMKTMIIVFAVIPVAIGALSLNFKKFLRLACFSALMTLGFFCYNLFMTYAYTAIFTREVYGYGLICYHRYMSSYCAGWFLAMCAACLSETGDIKWEKIKRAPGLALAVIMLVSTFCFSPVPADQFLITSPKLNINDPGYLGIRQSFWTARARYEQDDFTAEDRFCFVGQGLAGGEWFYFNYDFMPCYLVGNGGGTFVDPVAPDETVEYALPVDFTEYLREHQANFVYVCTVDEYFIDTYCDCFTDYLAGYFDRSCMIYMVVYSGSQLILEPVANSIQLSALRQKQQNNSDS